VRCIVFFICVWCNFNFVWGQQLITLPKAIQLAQQNSLQAALNKNTYEISNQTFRLQRAQLFPQVNLNANLPGYNSSITSVTQPDGSIRFATVEQAFSNVGISLSQKIAATGGTFTASSNINRFDRLSGNRSTNFNTQPFILGLNQPLFRFNETAFGIKKAQLNQLIGSKQFIKEQAQLALDVCKQYHLLLQSQQQLKLLVLALENTAALLNAAKLKWQLGKMGEEEYLQIQLEQLSTQTQWQQEKAKYALLKNTFCNLLAMPIHTELVLAESLPNQWKKYALSVSLIDSLLKQYQANNPAYAQQKLKQLQVEADLKRAKMGSLPSLNLIAGYGSNQSAPVLNDAYQSLLTQQNATVGLSMPLFSSGANAANLKIASYQLQNLQYQLQLFEQGIVNDLTQQVQQYNLALEQIVQAQMADSLAQRRYSISYNKYQVGKITYTDLLLAQNQKLQAKQGYLQAISAYWQAFYQLRVSTLFDLEKGERI
jgi:outer membrane protein TolC